MYVRFSAPFEGSDLPGPGAIFLFFQISSRFVQQFFQKNGSRAWSHFFRLNVFHIFPDFPKIFQIFPGLSMAWSHFSRFTKDLLFITCRGNSNSNSCSNRNSNSNNYYNRPGAIFPDWTLDKWPWSIYLSIYLSIFSLSLFPDSIFLLGLEPFFQIELLQTGRGQLYEGPLIYYVLYDIS